MPATNAIWQSFAAVASWPSPGSARRSFGHVRSLSSIARSPASSPLSHSLRPPTAASDVPPSTPDALGSAGPATPQSKTHHRPSHSYGFDYDLSTIPDPRSRAMSPALPPGASTPSHHPDLDDEVATLSTKLVNAINHQTTLDDDLSSTRLELAQSRNKIHELEEQVAQQREMLSGDVWIRRKNAEAEKAQLVSRAAEEKRLRQEAEQQKKKMELELENLTTALFEEANNMVISAKEDARREHEALQRKNDQLKAQLADTESLLKSQQEQLAELKRVMEQMDGERDDQTVHTVPSSPGFSRFDPREDDTPGPLDAAAAAAANSHPATSALATPLSPSHPTSFTHLLHPVLRTDLAAYADFLDLIRTSKRHSAHRASSGSHSGLAALGLGLGSGLSSSSAIAAASITGSAPALPAGPSSNSSTPAQSSSPQTPNTPASAVSTGSSASAHLPPLKDTKFYKRALAEDIEPTLRLDIAPGLSWLARRTMLSSVTDGTLVVEPVPTNTYLANIAKPQLYPCSLCGESRKDAEYLRTHRFRTNESDSAQRYPLCGYCLGRLRSACDFLGFLRIVKDGHWRADDADAEKAAWEESVRLREQMFWSRIGGGVVPATFAHHSRSNTSISPSLGDKSRRPSHEEDCRRASNVVEKHVPEKHDLDEHSTPGPSIYEEARASPPASPPESPRPEKDDVSLGARIATQGESLRPHSPATQQPSLPLSSLPPPSPPEVLPPTPDDLAPPLPLGSRVGSFQGDRLSLTVSTANEAK